MDDGIVHTALDHRTKPPKTVTCIYIFIFFTFSVEFAFSQPSESSDQCVLNFQNLTSSNDSSCEMGNWGGFLNKNCCGRTFQDYLYALGTRANQTRDIFLSSTDQTNCLATMKIVDENVLGCGIEKLTSGGGGCSDFTVEDVSNKLRKNLKNLMENCELDSIDEESDRSCKSCVKSWEEIRGIHNDGYSAESDICRFAVLVTLTSSRIQDEIWAHKIYKCLGEQASDDAETEGGDRKNKKIRIGLRVLVGGVIAIVAVLVTFLAWYLLQRRSKSNTPIQKDAPKRVAVLKESDTLKVPIKEVYSATNNLNELNLIGEGTAGKVYKGVMSSNQKIAVKHIINDGNIETFLREVRSLSHVRHPNLVALLGYCENDDECFLVYELCPNGNLSEWLFGKDKVLSWIQRLEIAIDSARGLFFLHTYPEGCIVHRDIKPTNILLGKNFEAKLSDFGLSKVIDLGEAYMSSEVRGTFGYVDPEYQSNHQVNSSGDVYSFGIVLLQILSGRKVMNMNLKNPAPLDKIAKSLTKDGGITGFADPKLDGEYSAEAFTVAFKLALSCTALKQKRPSMDQVVVKLQEALDISTRAKASSPYGTPDQSFNSISEISQNSYTQNVV